MPVRTAQAEEVMNLVGNPGFESGSTVPDVWSRGATGTWVWDNTVSHSGTKSAKLVTANSTQIAFFNQQYIAVQASQLYEFSSYYKPQNVTGRAFILLAWYSAPNATGFISQKLLDVDLSVSNWSKAVMREYAPANAQYAHVGVHLRGGAGTIWYDDVSLEKVIIETQVGNPGFENGGTAPDVWARGAADTWVWDNTVSHSGSKSAKLITTNSTQLAFFNQQYIPVQASQLYDFSSYYKPQNVTGRAFMLLAWYSAPNAAGFISQKVLDVDLSSANWSKAVMRELAPVNAQYAHVGLHLRGGAGTIWYDDVSLDKVILNSAIALSTTTYDKNELHAQDISLGWTSNGNTLEEVTIGSITLQRNSDYELTNDRIVLKSSFLSELPIGNSAVTFSFNEGADSVLNLAVIDSTGVSVPALQYYKNVPTPQSASVTLSTYGGPLAELWLNGSQLTLGEAYTITGDTILFNETFLNALPTQTYIVEFGFADTSTSSITLTILEIVSDKTRSTIYTPSKVQAARDNIAAYEWAEETRDAAVVKAEAYFQSSGYLAEGYDFFWKTVPPQTLPRSYAVNERMGSPVTGRDIDQYGAYPYRGDPIQESWKIVDPSSGYKFPTNDFGAYYRSGLDDSGIFRPAQADRSLLVNTLYPEKGPNWGVDDGFGWIDENGNHFTFIAYYVHRFVWFGEKNAFIMDGLRSMKEAYLYTGDPKYARAGLVMLDRIADIYPGLDTSVYKVDYLHNGAEGKGKAVGAIWETFLIKEMLSAYDAFFPAKDDLQLITFLQSKSAVHSLHNPKNSGAAIASNIEDGIVRQVYPAVKTGNILGNTGMHQSALAMAAVVYDTLPDTKDWLDFTFQAGSALYNPARVTGGNIIPSLVNRIDRDGQADEASPEYNSYWLDQFRSTADILQGYDLYEGADLYDNVKFKTMFSSVIPMVMSEAYIPSIGDSGRTGRPDVWLKLDHFIKAFETYGDPEFAQVAYFLNGNSSAGIHRDIFSTNPESIAADIEAVIATHGVWGHTSANMTGYGLTALRDGNGTDHNMRDLWMYYGRTIWHGHRDTLNIGLHAFGLDLSPDLGYPEFTDSRDMHRFQWVRNTISHNTVVVDKSQQQSQWVSTPLHYDNSERVKLIDVEAPDVYSQTEQYRRTTAMIQVDDTNSYSIDFFRVKGGTDHHFSFHGPEGSETTQGLDLVAQPTGTYAGPNVAYGQRVDSVEGTGYMGSGFHYLKEVERDISPADQFSVDWKVSDTWNVYGQGMGASTDVHMRLTMLGDYDEIALADGIPPQNKPGNPESLRYVIAHRSGSNLDSLFTSILEPYKNTRYIQSISPAQLKVNGNAVRGTEAAAVKVQLTNGRIDYIVNALNPEIEYTIDDHLTFKGFFGVVSEQAGEPEFAYMHGGTLLQADDEILLEKGQGYLVGEVADFTRSLSFENEIEVELTGNTGAQELRPGAFIFIQNDGARNAVYELKQVQTVTGNTYAISIGDKTLIRQYNNDADPSAGFIYDVAEGDSFRVPLTATWVSANVLLNQLKELVLYETSLGHISSIFSNQLIHRLFIINILSMHGNTQRAIAFTEDFITYIKDPSVLLQGLITLSVADQLGLIAEELVQKWST
jgi:hypothetical protein